MGGSGAPWSGRYRCRQPAQAPAHPPAASRPLTVPVGASRFHRYSLPSRLTQPPRQGLHPRSRHLHRPPPPVKKVVADKGYHSDGVLLGLEEAGQEAHIPEPQRAERDFEGKPEAKRVVEGNRERVGSAEGKRLQKLRTDKVERSMAHMYETGGMRRLYLRGRANIRKRLLVHACGFNRGVLMRSVTGIGTPRTLQGQGC